MLEGKESGSKGMSGVKALSTSAHPSLGKELSYEHKCKSGFRSELQLDTSRTLQKNTVWETMSIEEALARLEQRVQRPSAEEFICMSQKCRKMKILTYAECLYMNICDNGLEAHREVGNYLVPMFVECGSVLDAQQVFNRLVHRNECSWTSLIQGYIALGELQHALYLFHTMQEDNVHPSRYTFVAILKVCAQMKCVKMGREIHAQIANEGYERNCFVASTLVDMYAKCGSLAEAQEVFETSTIRDAVLWNALLAGYSGQGLGEEALNLLERMLLEGMSPDAVTFVCSLKACGSIGAIHRGREIHAKIAKEGFERDRFVGNTLVDMYAKCDSHAEAKEVLEKLHIRDVVSWNALISEYAEHRLGEETLHCLKQMQLEGVTPNAITYASILKACGTIGALNSGQEIHIEIVKEGYDKDLFVGNTLLDMYLKCGSFAEAWESFNMLSGRDLVSWNALITGCVECGLDEAALDCFEEMQLEDVSLDAVTFVCSLKACGSLGAIDRGQDIHSEIIKQGYERDLFVANTLVDMYAKCGLFVAAWNVLDKLTLRNVVSWNALAASYAEWGLGEEVLNCLKQMQLDGCTPDAVTFACSLKACGSIGAIDSGQEMHTKIVKCGFEKYPFVGTAIVDMYAKCGLLAEAQELFDYLPVRDTISWTSIMTDYAERGLGEEALNSLEMMQCECVAPDALAFVCSLKTCGGMGALDRGQETHIEIAKEGLERDPLIGGTLVDMYAKCGSIAEAYEVFQKLPVRDLVSWNALVAGYVDHGISEEALTCFEQMQLDSLSPNAVTFACSLKACGNLGAIEMGREIHTKIAKEGLKKDLLVGNTSMELYPQMLEQGLSLNNLPFAGTLKGYGNTSALEIENLYYHIYIRGLQSTEVFLATALIDMYGKCGNIFEAKQVFDSMPSRNLVTWNAWIAGNARQGQSDLVFDFLERMIGDGVQPDGITLLSVLTVCSHEGLVDKGHRYFDIMSIEYGINPTIMHHNCIVDLLGRAGQLDAATRMLEKMPFQPDLVTWSILLGACQKWGNVELGIEAFDHALRLEEKQAAAFVSMSNIYIDANMWVDVN